MQHSIRHLRVAGASTGNRGAPGRRAAPMRVGRVEFHPRVRIGVDDGCQLPQTEVSKRVRSPSCSRGELLEVGHHRLKCDAGEGSKDAQVRHGIERRPHPGYRGDGREVPICQDEGVDRPATWKRRGR